MAAVYSTGQDNSVKIGQVLGKFGKWEFTGFVVEKINSILRIILIKKTLHYDSYEVELAPQLSNTRY